MFFLALVDSPPWALGILATAALTDVLDGWAARRQAEQSLIPNTRGEWLDPLCDKIFLTFVLLAIYTARQPPVSLLLMTMSRDILQVVALIIYKSVASLRRLRYNYKAHPIGKAATVAQFCAAGALLMGHPAGRPLAITAAALGMMAFAIYVSRMIALARMAY